MTDIHQWRRMIQPVRARTPAVEVDDLESVASPTTPRKGLKPKLSSYFTQHTAHAGPSKTDLAVEDDLFGPRYALWRTSDPVPNPDAEKLIEAVMCRLLSDPYHGLDARFNSMLMRIFEGYRNLKDENEQLQVRIQQESDRCQALEHALHHSSQQWDRQRQDYKAEVKRLELLLAKGKRGLAEVTLARQDSVLKRGNQKYHSEDEALELERIFAFLERTKRYEDKAWSSQRATMRRRSPSAQMRRLSQTLATKTSMTNIGFDLPLGKPPLTDTSFLEEQHTSRRFDVVPPTPISEPKTSFSDDTLSTFSCAGDLLPDETADVNLIEAAGTDNDFIAIKRIAHVLAKRRNVDLDSVMLTLLDLFDARVFVSERSSSLPVGLGINVQRPATVAGERSLPQAPLRKNPTLRAKASGFFTKRKPQLNVDTSAAIVRKFSFEAGDDHNATLSATPVDNLPASVRERLIRKSTSMSFLEVKQNKAATQGPTLLSVTQSPAQSPRNSAPPQEWIQTPPDYEDSKRSSRIPTPVYRAHSLARPRPERDDSASSLLTAIRYSGAGLRSSGSNSSSSLSSPSASRTDLTQGFLGAESIQGSSLRGSGSNRLLNHTNALRSSVIAVAAAKDASSSTLTVDQEWGADHVQRSTVKNNNNSRSSTRSRTDSDMGELRKENHRPMGRIPIYGHDSNATR